MTIIFSSKIPNLHLQRTSEMKWHNESINTSCSCVVRFDWVMTQKKNMSHKLWKVSAKFLSCFLIFIYPGSEIPGRLSTDFARVSWVRMGSMSFHGNSMQAWREHVNSRHKQKSPANVSVLALRKQRWPPSPLHNSVLTSQKRIDASTGCCSFYNRKDLIHTNSPLLVS